MILMNQDDREKAKKVTDALMQMQKIDIDKLSAISAA
jgi:predicted 3-demethylubiquinone-9 3-methyltransferase (glyoxalase superfamily)